MISVTASASQDRRAQFLAAGMNDLLAKPLGLATLEQALQANRPAPRPGVPHGHTVPHDGAADSTDTGGSSGELAVDAQVLTDLATELDDVHAVRALIEMFLRVLPERVATITDTTAPSVRRADAAHTLGSGAAMVGAPALTARCRAIERGEPVPVDLPELCDQVAAGLIAWMGATARAEAVGGGDPPEPADQA